MMFTPKILYLQYTNPAELPPLEHSSRILANQGWEILFLGTDSFIGQAIVFPDNPQIIVKKMPFCPGGWRQKIHYFSFCFWVLINILTWQPQWVYASDLLACPIALLISFFPKVKVIYHEHDTPTKSANSFFIKLCLKTRKKLANKAEICILPNQQRLESFAKETNRKDNLFCVWNCPRLEEIESISNNSKDNNSIWLYYHGNISPPLLPTKVIYALAKLPENLKLRVIGYETVGTQGYIEQLKGIANDLKISDRIEFLPPMPRHKLLKYCQQCQIGIAFTSIEKTDINLNYLIGASNKVFDYLACGLGLLVCNLPDWKKIYVDSGYGLACDSDNPDSIAETLQWFLDHPEEMKQMGEKGRQKVVNEWNYEVQFKPVLEILHQSFKTN